MTPTTSGWVILTRKLVAGFHPQIDICTATHDYIRHGTLTLFTALSYLDGKIISQTAQRHTHAECLTFLKHVDAQTPADQELHLIVDNYATRKHPKVLRWLDQHPRFHLHFTPTSSSWMNMVERFFRDLTEDVVRNGSFQSVKDLSAAILEYLRERNLKPKPYQWRAQGADILARIQRARENRHLQIEDLRGQSTRCSARGVEVGAQTTVARDRDTRGSRMPLRSSAWWSI